MWLERPLVFFRVYRPPERSMGGSQLALKYKVIIGVLATFSFLVVCSPLAGFKMESESDLNKMAESSRGWFSAFGSLIGSILRSILYMFGSLGDFCAKIFFFIFKTLQKAVYGFWWLLKSIWNMITYIFSGILSGISTVLSRLWERIKELFKIDFELNLSSLSGVIKLLGNLLFFPVEKLVEIVKILLKMVGDIICAILGGLGSAYSDLGKTLSDALGALELPSLSGPFKRIVNGLARLGAAIKSIPLLSFLYTLVRMIIVLVIGLVRTIVAMLVSMGGSLKQIIEEEKEIL